MSRYEQTANARRPERWWWREKAHLRSLLFVFQCFNLSLQGTRRSEVESQPREHETSPDDSPDLGEIGLTELKCGDGARCGDAEPKRAQNQ